MTQPVVQTTTQTVVKTVSKLHLAVAFLYLSIALAVTAGLPQKLTSPQVFSGIRYFGGVGLKNNHSAVWQAKRDGANLTIVVSKRYVTNKLTGVLKSTAPNVYSVSGLLPNTTGVWTETATGAALALTENVNGKNKNFVLKFNFLKSENTASALALNNTIWRGYSSIYKYDAVKKVMVSMPIYHIMEFGGGKMADVGPYVASFYDYSANAVTPGQNTLSLSNRVAVVAISGKLIAVKPSDTQTIVIKKLTDNSIEVVTADGNSIILNKYQMSAGAAQTATMVIVPSLKTGLESGLSAGTSKEIDSNLANLLDTRYGGSRDRSGMMFDFMGNYLGQEMGGGMMNGFDVHFGNNRQGMDGNFGGGVGGGWSESFGFGGMGGMPGAGAWSNAGGQNNGGNMPGGVWGREDPSNMGKGMFFDDMGMFGSMGAGGGFGLRWEFGSNFSDWSSAKVVPTDSKGNNVPPPTGNDPVSNWIKNNMDNATLDLTTDDSKNDDETEKPADESGRPADPTNDGGGGTIFMPADPASDDPGVGGNVSMGSDLNSLVDHAFYPYDPTGDGGVGGMFYPVNDGEGGTGNNVSYGVGGSSAQIQNLGFASLGNFAVNGLNVSATRLQVSGKSVMVR
ncbi:MAG: hypothetical protein WCT40_03380 [Candidatus Magasanikbacteria bacterium]